MNPTGDALYRIHQFQAARRRLPPLDYYDFRRRVRDRSDTDLSQAFLPEPQDRFTPIFELGTIYATHTAMAGMPWYEFMMGLAFHERGNWGEVSPKQWLVNDLAVASGGRICSAHRNRFWVKFWLITEGDRHCTTIVMPEDTWFPGGIP